MWNVIDHRNSFKVYCGKPMWENREQSKTKTCESVHDVEEYSPHNQTLDLNKLRSW